MVRIIKTMKCTEATLTFCTYQVQRRLHQCDIDITTSARLEYLAMYSTGYSRHADRVDKAAGLQH